jgi:hypothetical protein
MRRHNSLFGTLLLVDVLVGGGCTDLKTDLPAPVAPGVIAHGVGWSDSTSPNFHGNAIRAANGDFQPCLKCHGLNFSGGTSNVSCVACHQSRGASLHGRGWIDTASANFHGDAIRSNGWDMRPCQSCHGAIYTGGKVNVSCRDCHTGAAGPENCTTCHGGVTAAPPRDLNKNTATTARGVGAHQRHLLGGGADASYTLACSECHNVPPAVYVTGHLDSPPPAEVIIRGALATADPTGVPGPPAYRSDSLRCSNTFCHGNWSLSRPPSTSDYYFVYTDTVMVGANYAPRWTGGAAEVACGTTCHATPPKGHLPFALKTCKNCHLGITDASGKIIDKTKHINGMIDVYGTEIPF